MRTSGGTWVIPTYRAVWIPAPVPHTITMSGAVAMRTLYLKPRLAKTLPRDCCVVNVSPLLKELVLHACTFSVLKKAVKRHRHLIYMMLDQLESVQMVPMQLPNPSDPRALRIATALYADPSDRRSLTHFSKSSGASKRTLERLFQEDVGMTFGKWRQQLRLMQAMRLLARRSQGNACRAGIGLQHAERIYLDVQESARDHSEVVFQSQCKARIVSSRERLRC